MDSDDFRDWSAKAANWGADYRETIRDRPVRAATRPGEIAALLPASPPELAEPMEAIFADFERTILPGMTHWQHPRFFAYFPANAAPVSVVAEYLVSAMAAQCMLWQTSPAATELETRMIDWMRQALGLPEGFAGVIQDSASSATLAAVLTMRERALDWGGNAQGLSDKPALRVYCSDQVHTSIDRAIWVSGIGEENLVRLPGSRRAARHGRGGSGSGHSCATARPVMLPAGIIASVGGTSVGGTDDVGSCLRGRPRARPLSACRRRLGRIGDDLPGIPAFLGRRRARRFDRLQPAQMAGRAVRLLDPVRPPIPDSLVQTLAIRPEFLKTHGRDGIINYSEWSVPLGRRFRALKLWFLLRAHGLEGLRTMIRNHVAWSRRSGRAGCAGAAGFRDRHRADAVAVLVPAPGRRRAWTPTNTTCGWSTRSTTTAAST